MTLDPIPATSAFPFTVSLETVNYCNSACIFCPLFTGNDRIDRKLRPAMTMDQDLFRKLIEEIAIWDVKPSIFLNMDGEPLLDKHFKERLRVLQKADLSQYVNLQTNAEYLTPETSAAILKAGLSSITIGFDGASKEVYESHRVGCHYDIVLGNIIQFVRIRASLRKSTALAIKFVRTKQNAHEVADAYKLFAGILNPWIDLFYDTISENWGNPALENIVFAETKTDMLPKYCGYPDNNLVILADGSVSACCFDYNLSIVGGPIGSVRRQRILDVWRGTSFENLRRSLRRPGRDGKPAKCLACGLSFFRPAHFYAGGPAIESSFVQSQENAFIYYFTKHLKIRTFAQLALGARSHGASWALRRGASLARSVLKRRFGIG
jgi:hypothetical protein